MRGNFDIVKEELKKNNVDDASIMELQRIIDVDQFDGVAKQPGKQVQGWMSKMFNKALDGSWKIAAGAAGKVLADVISHYYGW